jgi:hypothetical protein
MSMFIYIQKFMAIAVAAAFLAGSVKVPAFAQRDIGDMPPLPSPGDMVHLSPQYAPAQLKGLVIHPENPLIFDFLISRGDAALAQASKKPEYTKLIKYFLASLALPDDDQWVNLSPYEKDRIIRGDFGKTQMGRDLLAQDYMLKQITASLIHPRDNLGQKFWDKVYASARRQFGTSELPVNTFNKVWIVPDDALIFEKGNMAYVVTNHLKVLLEEDYLSLAKHGGMQPGAVNDAHGLSSRLVREIILPALEKEVNEGRNFAVLRQIFSGMVLAAWYKRALKESLLGRIYMNKSRLKGVDGDPRDNDAIYQRYLKAFKKGVFNFIREDVDKYTRETIPRRYFSGGATEQSYNQGLPGINGGRPVLRTERSLRPDQSRDAAMALLGSDLVTEENQERISDAAMKVLTVSEAQKQVDHFFNTGRAYYFLGQIGRNNMGEIKEIAVELLQELYGQPLYYVIYGSSYTKSDLTIDPEINLMKLRNDTHAKRLKLFFDILFYRWNYHLQRPSFYTDVKHYGMYARLMTLQLDRDENFRLAEALYNVAYYSRAIVFERESQADVLGRWVTQEGRRFYKRDTFDQKRFLDENMKGMLWREDFKIARKASFLLPDEKIMNRKIAKDIDFYIQKIGLESKILAIQESLGNRVRLKPLDLTQADVRQFLETLKMTAPDVLISDNGVVIINDATLELPVHLNRSKDSIKDYVSHLIEGRFLGYSNPSFARIGDVDIKDGVPRVKISMYMHYEEIIPDFDVPSTRTEIRNFLISAGVMVSIKDIIISGNLISIRDSIFSLPPKPLESVKEYLSDLIFEASKHYFVVIKVDYAVPLVDKNNKPYAKAVFSISHDRSNFQDIDYAMTVSSRMGPADLTKGGIDFNAANLNLQIKRDTRGVPLPVSRQDLEKIHIDGLVPVILDIRPAKESSLLSEFLTQAPPKPNGLLLETKQEVRYTINTNEIS